MCLGEVCWRAVVALVLGPAGGGAVVLAGPPGGGVVLVAPASRAVILAPELPARAGHGGQ